MTCSEKDLRAAQAAGIISPLQLEQLIAFLAGRRPAEEAGGAAAPRFDAAHLLWYAGALIVIGAMGLFSTAAFSRLGGWALSATALVYAIAFTCAGSYLWHRKGLTTPGGLLAAIAVSMAPLAVFGVQKQIGWWAGFEEPGQIKDFYEWIKGSWVFMELATIIAGAVALRFFSFPFIVAIIACALWLMSMDLTPWIYGTPYFSWEQRSEVSIWFGLAVVSAGWAVDYARRPRFAFWLHFFGLMAFWGGLSASDSGGEMGKAVYALINLGLLMAAVVLSRQVYAVFGAIGLSIYLGHLAGTVFRDSLLFPFALTAIGAGAIGCGLLYRGKEAAIAAWIETHLPAPLLRFRPDRAP